MTALPPDTKGDWEGVGPCCPWCGEAVLDEARVTLEQLLCAHGSNQLWRPDRDADGRPDPGALVSACPVCARPFAVAIRLEHGFPVMRLLAVRTAADVRLLSGGANDA